MVIYVNTVYKHVTVSYSDVWVNTQKNFEEINKLFDSLQQKYLPNFKGCNVLTFELDPIEERDLSDLLKSSKPFVRYWNQ